MQLKTNEDGSAVVKDGNIILVDDQGKEQLLDPINASETIAELRVESAKHRKNWRAAESKLETFKGIEDPTAALDALATVKTLGDDHKANVEQLKSELSTQFGQQLQQKDETIQSLEGRVFKMAIGDKFHTSEVAKKLILPPSRQADLFAGHFKVNEDGEVVGQLNGTDIYSAKQPGKLADFDEAYERIIDAQPDRDQLLRSSGARGSGSPPGRPGETSVPSGEDQSSAESIAAGLKDRGWT